MTDQSYEVHIGTNAKRYVSKLPDDRRLAFTAAIERLMSDPEPNGRSKICVDWFPYYPGIVAYSGFGFVIKYKLDEKELHIGSVYDRHSGPNVLLTHPA